MNPFSVAALNAARRLGRCWVRGFPAHTKADYLAVIDTQRYLMLTFLHQLFCLHRGPSLLRVKDNRLFTECLRCGHLSKGILTGVVINPYRKEEPCSER